MNKIKKDKAKEMQRSNNRKRKTKDISNNKLKSLIKKKLYFYKINYFFNKLLIHIVRFNFNKIS